MLAVSSDSVVRGALAASVLVALAGAVGGMVGCAKGEPTLTDRAVALANVSRASMAHAPARTELTAAQKARGLNAALLEAIGMGDRRAAVAAASSPEESRTLRQLLPEPETIELDDTPSARRAARSCPSDMVSVGDRFCVDRYEASLVEILPNGEERPWSPFATVDGHVVRAVSEANVYPQAYISGHEAAVACARSGKRLCGPSEWRTACMGPSKSTFGYGNDRVAGRCNDHGKSAMGAIYGTSGRGGRSYWSMDRMNDPSLNQVPGTLAHTGEHGECTNGYGVYDMVGNVHEWVADPRGTFQGGYYLDTHLNGDGCTYRTTAHEAWYHDYSTGFRCCADM
jgi:hypothetical protein